MAANVDIESQKEKKVLDNIKKKLHFFKISENGVCQLYDAPPQTSGYVLFSYKNPKTGRTTSTTMGKAVKMLEKNTIFLDPECEASHICHNKTCILVDHIEYEPHTVNVGRKACVRAGYCLKNHGLYKNCLVHLYDH